MDKIAIVLSPSQQIHNQCAVCKSEANHMRLIFDILNTKLIQDPRLDIYLIPALKNSDQNQNLIEAVELSNKFVNERKPSLHVCGHSDAGGGSGASAFWQLDGGLGEKLGRAIYNRLVNLTPWKDMKAYARPELYELRKTDASAALFEVSFHDDVSQAKWIHSNISEIADCFYFGIYEALGLAPYKKDDESQALVDEMYKDGLITSKDIWVDVFAGKKQVQIDWIKTICKRAVEKI